MIVHVVKNLLSDGSPVWDVKLGDITFGCITERDAYALADDIETAVQKHTNEIVTVSTERA